jgi:hypothetical protein
VQAVDNFNDGDSSYEGVNISFSANRVNDTTHVG